MDAGLIATRYARALLLYAREERTEASVYEDAQKLLDALKDKTGLTACIEGLSQTLRHFVALVVRNKRVEYLPAILHNFRVLYRQEHGITRAWLTTAAEDPELAGKLTTLMKLQGFTKIDFRTEVNQDLIGGFILQIEDKRLDASIASQLRTIRKEWEEKNRNNRKNG